MTEDSFQGSSLTRCLILLLTESKNIHATDNFVFTACFSKEIEKKNGAGTDTNVSERFETLIFVCVQHMCLRAHTCACVLIISSVKLLQASVGRNDCSDKQMAPFGLLIIGTAGWQWCQSKSSLSLIDTDMIWLHCESFVQGTLLRLPKGPESQTVWLRAWLQ